MRASGRTGECSIEVRSRSEVRGQIAEVKAPGLAVLLLVEGFHLCNLTSDL
jgi:hypothetical protein